MDYILKCYCLIKNMFADVKLVLEQTPYKCVSTSAYTVCQTLNSYNYLIGKYNQLKYILIYLYTYILSRCILDAFHSLIG